MNQIMVPKMDQMVVYRIEDPDSRIGMYTSGGCVAFRYMSGGRQHPGPYSDNRLKTELNEKNSQLGDEDNLFVSQCKFGFASKKQMRNWVSQDEWKQKLAEEGLIVAKYRVPKEMVAIGNTQAIFHPQHAELVSTMCPTKI